MCERLPNTTEYSEPSPAADDPIAKRKSYSPVIEGTNRERGIAACKEAKRFCEECRKYLEEHPEVLAHLD